MKKSSKKKLIALAVSLAVLSALVVGGTLMVLLDKTEDLVNTFEPSEVTCVIEEDSFDGSTKSGVTVRNTSDIDAYLRAAVIVNWVDAQGNVLGQSVNDNEYTISGMDAKWSEGSDGYYYYADRVAPGAETTNLIGECMLASGVTAPDGYYLSMTILADAIQADPVQARTDAGWVIK